MRTLTLAVLSLAACSPAPPERQATTDPGTDGPEETRLEEGLYRAATPDLQNDTCNGAVDGLDLLPVDLVWTGEASFELRYEEGSNVTDVLCTVEADDAVTCGGFTQTFGNDMASASTVAQTDAFRVTSSRSFEIDWTWTLDCEGDCGEVIPYPCTIDVFGVFAL